MQNLIDTVIDFNEKVFRNIQWQDLRFSVFDDLSAIPEDWDMADNLAFATKTIHYHAIDHVFEYQKKPTRFSNGKFPVWYGSLEIDTTFYETAYHWKNGFLNDFMTDKTLAKLEKPPPILRRIFNVSCTSILIDFRSKINQFEFLTGTSAAHYKETQALGLKISKNGLSGLITKSARNLVGNNVAIFNKTVLHTPEVENDYRYQLSPKDPSIVQVLNHSTQELLLEVEV